MVRQRLWAFIFIAGLLGCSTTGKGNRNPSGLWGSSAASPMSKSDLMKAASSSDLEFSDARVIMDNDSSFRSKVNAIKSAQSGETIRLVYYIYTDDQSSSYFSQELIAAAKRGVKVRLMVDFLTNYKFLDLFQYMEDEGGPNLQVRLYGKPSGRVVRDIGFMTTPCPAPKGIPDPTYCADHKWNQWRSAPGTAPDIFANLMAVGLFTKKPDFIQFALSRGQVVGTDPANSKKPTQEELKDLADLGKLVYRAKVKGDIGAMIMLSMASVMYSAEVNPVLNEIYGRIPLTQMQNDPKHGSALDWEHLSDYTHHKLLLVENRFMQLGGRNVENAYHQRRHAMNARKYVFMDVDFAGNLKSGGDTIAESYDDLWNFTPMVMDIEDVYSNFPNDYNANRPEKDEYMKNTDVVTNDKAALETFAACTKGKPYTTVEHRAALMECIQNGIVRNSKYKARDARIASQGKHMTLAAKQYKAYEAQIKQTVSGPADIELSSTDFAQMTAAYIENLNFSRGNKTTRSFGVVNGQEARYGKYIHDVWLRGLENVCAVSAKDKVPRRVILHNAYVFFPTNLVTALTSMIDGTWDCRNVTVQIITNSFFTTDLNVINVLADHQLMAFFQIYRGKTAHYGPDAATKGAQVQLFEYRSQAGQEKRSLHSKLSVLGDDIIIGSANADVRSYYMDTNNGIYLKNAKELIAIYNAYIDGLLKNKSMIEEKTDLLMNYGNLESYLDDNMQRFDSEAGRRMKTDTPEGQQQAAYYRKHFHTNISGIGKTIHEDNQFVMSPIYRQQSPGPNTAEPSEEKVRTENKFNRSFSVF